MDFTKTSFVIIFKEIVIYIWKNIKLWNGLFLYLKNHPLHPFPY